MMESDMATLAIYNEELVTSVTLATNDEEFDMAVERERKQKDVEEFESIFRSNNCQLTEDVEFARMYNMTAFQYDEMESVYEFDKAFDADVAEQDSGYQEVCPTLEGGCSMDEFEASLSLATLLASSCAEARSRRSRAEKPGWVVAVVLFTLNPKPGPPTSATDSMLESVASSTTSKSMTKVLAAALEFIRSVETRFPVLEHQIDNAQPCFN
jgi:hypothetical protein